MIIYEVESTQDAVELDSAIKANDIDDEEPIKIEILDSTFAFHSFGLLFLSPYAPRIESLKWTHDHSGRTVEDVIPLLVSYGRRISSLEVSFSKQAVLDFLSYLLETHTAYGIHALRTLILPLTMRGDTKRFFAALSNSRVNHLEVTTTSPHGSDFDNGLFHYVMGDHLDHLTLKSHYLLPDWLDDATGNLVNLTSLRLEQCDISYAPRSTTEFAAFIRCRFPPRGGFDWNMFLSGRVEKLIVDDPEALHGGHFSQALFDRVHIRPLKFLSIRNYVAYGLFNAAGGNALFGVERFAIEKCRGHEGWFDDVVHASTHPNSLMRYLSIDIWGNMHQLEQLRHALLTTNFPLDELRIISTPYLADGARRLEDFVQRSGELFTLMQGRSLRRMNTWLKKLPFEMFRLVGLMM